MLEIRSTKQTTTKTQIIHRRARDFTSFISHFNFHEIQKNKIDDEHYYNVTTQLLPINLDVP